MAIDEVILNENGELIKYHYYTMSEIHQNLIIVYLSIFIIIALYSYYKLAPKFAPMVIKYYKEREDKHDE